MVEIHRVPHKLIKTAGQLKWIFAGVTLSITFFPAKIERLHRHYNNIIK